MLQGMSKQDWGIDVGGNSYGGCCSANLFSAANLSSFESKMSSDVLLRRSE